MNVYEWRMPEQELACCCTVTAFVVQTLKPFNRGKEATGTISMCDHIEGCPFENKWEAIIGLEDEGHYNIKIKPVDSWAGDGFTCNNAINKAADGFVVEKLTRLLDRLAGTEPTETIVERVSAFSGEMLVYTGSCVCEQLRSASKQTPFPWQELTSGRFPERCFGCSCGKNWWCYDSKEELWTPVGDPKAWSVLTSHNGVPVKSIAEHPEKHTIFLLQTLRSEGFIPIG